MPGEEATIFYGRDLWFEEGGDVPHFNAMHDEMDDPAVFFSSGAFKVDEP